MKNFTASAIAFTLLLIAGGTSLAASISFVPGSATKPVTQKVEVLPNPYKAQTGKERPQNEGALSSVPKRTWKGGAVGPSCMPIMTPTKQTWGSNKIRQGQREQAGVVLPMF